MYTFAVSQFTLTVNRTEVPTQNVQRASQKLKPERVSVTTMVYQGDTVCHESLNPAQHLCCSALCTLCNYLTVTEIDINSCHQLAAAGFTKLSRTVGQSLCFVKCTRSTSPCTAVLQQQGIAARFSTQLFDTVWLCMHAHMCPFSMQITLLHIKKTPELESC